MAYPAESPLQRHNLSTLTSSGRLSGDENKFLIIYSENVSELNLEWQRQPTKLEDNWYYFDGDI